MSSFTIGTDDQQGKVLTFGENIYKWKREEVYKRSLVTDFFVKQCYEDDDGNICEDVLCKEGGQQYRYLLFIGRHGADTGYCKSGTCMRYEKDECMKDSDTFYDKNSKELYSDSAIACEFVEFSTGKILRLI